MLSERALCVNRMVFLFFLTLKIIRCIYKVPFKDAVQGKTLFLSASLTEASFSLPKCVKSISD